MSHPVNINSQDSINSINSTNRTSAAFPHPLDSIPQTHNILELLPSRLSCEQVIDAMRWLTGIVRRDYGFTHQVMFAGLAARVFQESDPQRPVEAKLGAGEGLSDLAMSGVGMLWGQEDTIRVAAGKQDFDGIGEKWYVDDGEDEDEEEDEDGYEWDDEDDDENWGDEEDEDEEDGWDDDEYCLDEENYLGDDENDDEEEGDDE